MKERFWEKKGIYGGISWTLQDIQQIWYPAHGIHRHKGVVLSAYTFDPESGEKFARLTPAERIKLAVEQGSKVHPDYGKYVTFSLVAGASLRAAAIRFNLMGQRKRGSKRWAARASPPLRSH